MSPNSAQGQSTSELTADEQLDILLREHERKQKERNAQHVHQTDQVFRALQLPQQEHLAPITSTSASSLPPSSAAIAPPNEGSTSALRETGSLILETAERMERQVEGSRTLRETVSQDHLSGDSGSGFGASRSGKPVASGACEWRREQHEEMWRQANTQRGSVLT